MASQIPPRKEGSRSHAISRRRKRQRHDDEKEETTTTTRKQQQSNTKTTSSSSLTTVQAPADIAANANPYGRCPNVSLRYEKLNRIGEGTYGIVYRARDKETGEIVALKRCLPHHESSDGFPLTTLREITILRDLTSQQQRHPDAAPSGVVQLRDVAVSSSRSGVFLVFEYCEHDMATLVDGHYATHGRSPFRESEVKRLALQLLSALQFVHSRHVIHRDVKLSNLLYNHSGQLRLADFGLARRRRFAKNGQEAPREPENLTPKVVSLWYRSPELLLGSESYSHAVDNWSAACVIAEMLTGTPVWKGSTEMDQITKIFHFLGAPTPETWPKMKELPLLQNGSIVLPSSSSSSPSPPLDKSRPPPPPSSRRSWEVSFPSLSNRGRTLLENLWCFDPDQRWSARQALQSAYFTERPMPTNPALMPTFPTKHNGK